MGCCCSQLQILPLDLVISHKAVKYQSSNIRTVWYTIYWLLTSDKPVAFTWFIYSKTLSFVPSSLSWFCIQTTAISQAVHNGALPTEFPSVSLSTTVLILELQGIWFISWITSDIAIKGLNSWSGAQVIKQHSQNFMLIVTCWICKSHLSGQYISCWVFKNQMKVEIR